MRAIVAYASEGIGADEDVHLQVDLESGLMQSTRQVASPNCDARPSGVEAELIVVHGISLPPGEFGGPWIDRLFTNSLPPDMHPYFAEIGELRVSAHMVVARDGGLTQYVRFTDRAWHAGESRYNGRVACNDFSKESIRSPTKPPNTTPSPRSWRRSVMHILDYLPIGW
jgi:hypothetical protein